METIRIKLAPQTYLIHQGRSRRPGETVEVPVELGRALIKAASAEEVQAAEPERKPVKR